MGVRFPQELPNLRNKMNAATFNYAQELLEVLCAHDTRHMSKDERDVANKKFSDAYEALPPEFKPYDNNKQEIFD